MHRLISPVLAATLFVAAIPAAAQDVARLRGEVTSLADGTATVETTTGDSYDVSLSDDLTVIVYEYIGVEDVKMMDFLSIPSVTSDTGEKVALSINVFPEEMRGTNEGETAWDLTQDSLMTNATVGEVVNAADGSVIVVMYDDKEEPVLVPDGTAITRFAPDPDRDLVEGDQVLMFVQQDGDGLTSALVGVTEDGSLPPV